MRIYTQRGDIVSDKKKKLIFLIYGLIMSVVIIAVGALFIISCITIYRSAEDDPYSREVVAEAFSRIAIFVYILLFGIAAGVLLRLTVSSGKGDIDDHIMDMKKRPNHRMIRNRLARKIDMQSCPPELSQKILRERTIRLISNCACSIVCTAAGFIALTYLLNAANFTDEINKSIINAFAVTALWCFIAFDMTVACSLLINNSSIKREISLIKEAIKISGVPSPQKCENDNYLAINIARACVLVVAVTFIVLGVLNGGMGDVLGKAIRLCTECIGLG